MTPDLAIAIVDDDALVRAGMSSLIRSLDLSATTFASAEDFLAGNTHGFSCVISDVQMPGMSGLDLQRALQVRDAGLPIILMTAFPEARVRLQALDQGAAGFIEKPCDPDALIVTLEAALASGRRAR
ncbi:response regulator transcription factor [Polymorphobacter fuscus]|uniref:Response regulator n=1 Tax=Sandarakinorhabdus fusca TaxID=1439888 RepID=A0A7C9GUU7_9SPHN|nr:response regulator [Polymorphobacter fuscus]KAB7648247.1 response regulator [Polymorphobacter fuscus]MQT15754.1 response regulator [Polymorphobacter fuscus]NJC07975.1 FixJ family two-component response regulator [Polymorphobacter fuscus]